MVRIRGEGYETGTLVEEAREGIQQIKNDLDMVFDDFIQIDPYRDDNDDYRVKQEEAQIKRMKEYKLLLLRYYRKSRKIKKTRRIKNDK